MEVKERLTAAKKLFRQIDQALSGIPDMDMPSQRITCSILRSVNEELCEQFTKLIKNEGVSAKDGTDA